MALDALVGETSFETVGTNLGNGMEAGLVRTLNIMAYTGGAAMLGYLVGDLAPQAVDYAVNHLGAALQADGLARNVGAVLEAVSIPRGFGVPDALSVPEQVIFGHDYARNIPMAYLAAAPVVAKYVGEHIIAPLVRPLVDVVRR